MQLRSGKVIRNCPRENITRSLCDNISTTSYIHYSNIPECEPLHEWLARRISGILYDYNKFITLPTPVSHTDVVDRVRLLGELVHVIYTYIDVLHINTTLRKLADLTLVRMREDIYYITNELMYKKSVYSDFERNYLGNVRAETLKCYLFLNKRHHLNRE
jgi:hypothetical protein